MLFDRARADIELTGNLSVAAALDEQIQNLPVAGSNFDLNEIDHCFLLRAELAHVTWYCKSFAICSRADVRVP